MKFLEPEDYQRTGINNTLAASTLDLNDLWLRYFSVTGDADVLEIEGYLSGILRLPSVERDKLVAATNEFMDGECCPSVHVPYSHEL
ncbi:MAG: hypothetical protein JWO93_1499 [Micrococcaceae bacterium]|nr:hypothetical protein [Micrococcaceae bacterium]